MSSLKLQDKEITKYGDVVKEVVAARRMDPLPVLGKLTVERILIKMVVQQFLDEETVANAAGFFNCR